MYISENLLDRLKNGRFVARRKATVAPEGDRRNVVSPLAVTKRCVRYDPWVYQTRLEDIIQMAESLNSPHYKMLLLRGEEGMGKTVLARGLVQLLGSGSEQLLWFDASPHTDFEDLIGFLFRYLTTLKTLLGLAPKTLPPEEEAVVGDPFSRLKTALSEVQDIPLLIVIDNTEHLVDSMQRLKAPLLREMLNFLLGMPHIKLLMIGEVLPLADIHAQENIPVRLWEVKALNEAQQRALIRAMMLGDPDATPLELSHSTLPEAVEPWLMSLSGGYPWILRMLLYWGRQFTGNGERGVEGLLQLMALIDQAGYQPITHPNQGILLRLLPFVMGRASQEERFLLELLACIRHPLGLDAIQELGRLAGQPLFVNDETRLIEGWLRPLCRKTFPPQAVLDHIQAGANKKKFQPYLSLYSMVSHGLMLRLLPDTAKSMHQVLAAFYDNDKQRALENRRYPAKRHYLADELGHHQKQIDWAGRNPSADSLSDSFRYGNAPELFVPVKAAEPVVTLPPVPETLPDYRVALKQEREKPQNLQNHLQQHVAQTRALLPKPLENWHQLSATATQQLAEALAHWQVMAQQSAQNDLLAEAHVYQGMLKHSQQAFQQADVHFSQAIAMLHHTTHPKGYRLLAQAYQHMGKIEAARQHLDDAMACYEKAAQYFQKTPQPSQANSIFIQLAQWQYDAQQYEPAIDSASAALAADASLLQAYRLLGNAQLALHAYSAAIQAYQQGLAQAQQQQHAFETTAFHFALSTAYQHANNSAQALVHLKSIQKTAWHQLDAESQAQLSQRIAMLTPAS